VFELGALVIVRVAERFAAALVVGTSSHGRAGGTRGITDVNFVDPANGAGTPYGPAAPRPTRWEVTLARANIPTMHRAATTRALQPLPNMLTTGAIHNGDALLERELGNALTELGDT
jgi:hypothetical protein